MTSEIDRLAAGLAAAQHGVVARWQLLDRGVDRRAIDRRIGSPWVRRQPGVYTVPGHRRTWEQRLACAVLVDRRAVASGPAGAALWGLGGLRRETIDITVPPDIRPRVQKATVRRSPLIERRVQDGIPVNAPEYLVAELAAQLDRERLGALVDDAVVAGLTRVDRVGDLVVRRLGPQARGRRLLVEVLRARGDGYVPPESELERLLVSVLRKAPIPPLQLQATFPWRPTQRRRVDARIVGWPVLIEADGRAWHARLDQMAADRARDREALAHGFLTLRFCWHELHDEPARCCADVVAAAAAWGPEREWTFNPGIRG